VRKPSIQEAKEQARLECSSFVDCSWDEDNKTFSFWFKNPLDAETFRIQRELKDNAIRREVKADGAYTMMAEYYQ
jgi:hypothetical protein